MGWGAEPESVCRRRCSEGKSLGVEGGIMVRALAVVVVAAAIVAGSAGTALAQSCTKTGADVTCDDGRRGVFSGHAIIWSDGTRSNLASPHPSVIVGNRSSVVVGQGVFVGQGTGSVPMENPSDPRRARCPVLDGVACCYLSLAESRCLHEDGALPLPRLRGRVGVGVPPRVALFVGGRAPTRIASTDAMRPPPQVGRWNQFAARERASHAASWIGGCGRPLSRCA
jgi:hypothetical protein